MFASHQFSLLPFYWYLFKSHCLESNFGCSPLMAQLTQANAGKQAGQLLPVLEPTTHILLFLWGHLTLYGFFYSLLCVWWSLKRADLRCVHILPAAICQTVAAIFEIPSARWINVNLPNFCPPISSLLPLLSPCSHSQYLCLLCHLHFCTIT